MATCSLNQESLTALNVKVIKDLKELSKTEESFNLKEYSKGIYDFILNATNDHAISLDASRIVPLFVARIAINNKDVRKLVGSKAIEYADLTDELLEKDLDATEEFLGLSEGENIKDALDDLNEQEDEEEELTPTNVQIKNEFKGKLIYATPGAGKSFLFENYPELDIIDSDPIKVKHIENTEWGKANPFDQAKITAQNYIFEFSKAASDEIRNKVNQDTLAELKDYTSKGYTVLTGTIKFIPEVDLAIDVDNEGVNNRFMTDLADFKFKESKLLKTLSEEKRLSSSDNLSDILLQTTETEEVEETPVTKKLIKPLKQVATDVLDIEAAEDKEVLTNPKVAEKSVPSLRTTRPDEVEGVDSTSYRIQRMLLDLLGNSALEDMSELPLTWKDGTSVGGVYISILETSKVDTRGDIDSAEFPYLYVITDRFGEPIKFDDDLKPDLNQGSVAYFKMTSPAAKAAAAKNLADKTNLSLAKAKKVIEREDAEQSKVNSYILNEDTTEPVIYNITGGSRGIVLIEKAKAKRTSLKEPRLEKGNPELRIGGTERTGGLSQDQILDGSKVQPMGVYYTNDNLGGKYVIVRQGPVRETEYKDTIIQLLTAKEVYNSKGKLLTVTERKDAIQQFIHLGTIKSKKIKVKDEQGNVTEKEVKSLYGINMTADKTSPYGYKLYITDIANRNNGNIISLEVGTDEAKNAIIDYLETNMRGNKNARANINFNVKKYENNPIIKKVVEQDGKLVLVETEETYQEMFNKSATVEIALDPDISTLEPKNSYFTLQLTEESMNNVYDVKPVSEEDTTQSEEVKKFKDNKPSDENDSSYDISDDELFRSTDVANRSKEATQEQIAAAEKWWNSDSNPLKKYISFKAMFNVINSEGVASFSRDGITLFQGSDFTDIYHESWHGFTQLFMTKKEKDSLYKEVRKKSGSFLDHKNVRVRFEDASDLQIEEYLAEEFRQYMLRGQKAKKGSPKQNSFFRKVWNILKSLFGDARYNEIVLDDTVDYKINTLFEKLRVGDIKEYTFSTENASFDTLYKGIAASSKNDINELNLQTSLDIVNMVDYFINEWITKTNAELTPDQVTRYRELISKEIKTQSEKIELNSFAARKYTGASRFMQNPLDAYKHAYRGLIYLRNQARDEFNTQPTDELAKKIETLEWAISEFGNLEDFSKNKTKNNRFPKGVIAYHLNATRLFKDQVSEIDFENVNEDDIAANSQRAGIDRTGNETSLVEGTKPEIIWLLKSLIDPSSVTKYGLPEKSNYKETIVKIIRATENTQDYALWAKAFNQLADTDPVISQLRNKLGNPEDIDNALPSNTNMWSGIWQAFNKSRIPLVTAVNVISYDEDSSPVLEETNVGVALAESNVVQQAWDGAFSSGKALNKEYMTSDADGTMLNIEKILKDFNISSVKENPFEFLRAIGINVSDIPQIRKELRNHKLYNVAAYYRNILAIKNLGLQIRSISQIANPTSIKGLKKSQRETLTSITGYYKNLAELEQDYSYKFTNFSKVNAEGNVQYEHSLNNYLTTVVNGINNAETYEELIANPAMSQFNIKKNPFAKHSTWLNSVFDLKTGKKRKKRNGQTVKLQLYNLAGGLFLDKLSNENIVGKASAKSDKLSKISLDISLNLAGYPELLRHADKSTSYGVRVDGPIIQNDVASKSFFTIEDAVKDDNGFAETVLERMKGVLYAELTRMEAFNTMPLGSEEDFDWNYFTEGVNFHYFDDIIGNDTTLGEKIKDIMLSKEAVAESGYTISQIEDDVNGIRSEIEAAILKYFDHLLAKDRVASTDYYLSNKTKAEINNALPTELKNNKQAIDEVVNKVYVFNQFLNNIESTMFLYGDIALYNHLKEELHKRNAGAGSTGTIYRTDPIIQKIITNLNNKNSYANEINADPSVNEFTGSIKTAIAEDNNVGSIYYNKLVEILGEEGAADYAKQNEADAQGLITIDAYRALKISQGSWDNVHQKIYNKAIKGEVTPEEITKFFPVIKGQYWGPVENDFTNVMGFHKYSLYPLIPSVIKDTNAEIVHKRMTREGIAYLTFESGSKVGNITKGGVFDKLYKDRENKILVDELKSDDVSTPYFTPNVIRLEYLKDQLYIHDEDKGKIVFSTQLRKLAELGLYVDGIPSDFMKGADYTDRKKAWDKLDTEEARKDASDNYKLAKVYENLISSLSGLYKERLLKQIGWDGVSPIDNNAKSRLVEIAKVELERNDVGYERVNAINNIKGDYSTLLDAETIDKIINSLIEKNLVKQKVNGESLVQVANTLMEKADSFTDINFRNPTKEDFEKYNAKSLPYYEEQFDEEGNPLPTSAMKVKVALRGKFLNLLNFKDLDGNRIGTIKKLNELIKDDNWLNKDNNRAAITMVGVRIPVQGVNSMEVMEVYEFLDRSAGNIIIPPAEIVTKSGADFDVDKMTIMMPNIITKVQELNETSIEYLKQTNPDLNFSEKNIEIAKEAVNTGQALFTLTPEQEALAEAIIEFTTGEGEYVVNDKIAGTENKLIQAMRDIILRPENFKALTTPNSTDIFEKEKDSSGKTLVKEAAEYNMFGYNSNNLNIEGPRYQVKDKNKEKKMISPTTTLEPGYNLAKHQHNKLGKEVLGQGAVDNTYNALSNRIGLIMTEANMSQDELDIIIEERDKVLKDIQELEANNRRVPKSLRNQYNELNESYYSYREHNLRLQHNKSGKGISLAKDLSVDGRDISDVINQLMNGWVDVAKKAWVFDVQANKEMTPALLFMVQAGVPVREAVLFLSNPLIQQYSALQRRFNSPASLAIDDTYAGNYYRVQARKTVMSLVSSIGQDSSALDVTIEREDFLKNYGEKQFTIDEIRNNLDKWNDNRDEYVYTDFDKAVFYHYLQIEEMSNNVRDIKMSTNVDTSKDATSVEVRERLNKLSNLAQKTFTVNVVEELQNNSPIGSFFNTDLQLEILENLLPFRNHKGIYDLLGGIIEDDRLKAIEPDKARRIRLVLNDLNYYIFQNEVKYFDATKLKTHKGYKTILGDKTVKLIESGLRIGGVAVDTNTGVIDVNIEELKKQFNNNVYTRRTQFQANVAAGTFRDFNEYVNFAIERELFAAQNSLEDVQTSKRFSNSLKFNLQETKKQDGESQEEFEKRVIGNTYNNYVRDNALRNIFNYRSLFKGSNSVASEFIDISNNFPELAKKLEIFKQVVPIRDKNVNSLHLKLLDSKIDGDMINVLNENIKYLSSMKRLNDLIPDASQRDKKEIIRFFKNFSVYGYMQSGWKSQGAYAINKLGDQRKVQALMRRPANILKNMLDDMVSQDDQKSLIAAEFLTNYFKTFTNILINERAKASSIKGVNYFRNTSVTDVASIETIPETEQDEKKYLFDPIEDQSEYVGSAFNLPKARLVPRLSIKMPDGTSKTVLALSDKRGIYIKKGITIEEFFDYFEGKADLPGAEQKGEVIKRLAQFGNKKYNLKYIKELLNTVDKVQAFLVLHEADHIYHKDSYTMKNLMSEEALEMETRATYNALLRLEELIAGETVVNEEKSNDIIVRSAPYGVVTAETNPSKSLTQRFIDLIKPQIKNQAYKENNSGTANDMFSFGLRWTRKSKAKKPIVNRSFANKGRATTDALAKAFYVYDTLDQNGKPLAPISDLQPIIEHIQNSLGIDMSDYDTVLGNIYLPGQNVSTHRDTTESESARNYPVIVYTIGNASGINIHESSTKPGAISFASDPAKTIPTKDGTIYTFGLDGKGRFEAAHDTPRNMKRDVEQPPITLPNGQVITNYTITLTFRRAADLTPGMATAPAKITTQPTVQDVKQAAEPVKKSNPVDIDAKFPKDQVKADYADGIIGYGVGSTGKYAEAFGGTRKTFAAGETIMISVNGKGRPNQAENIEKTKAAIDQAISMGVIHFIADNKNTANSQFNKSGEGVIRDYLLSKGLEYKSFKGVGLYTVSKATSTKPTPKKESLTGLTYNEKQTEAIDAMEEFLASDKDQFTLIGKAGTGKTTIMKEVLMRELQKNPTTRIKIAAISHKAKDVLSNTLGDDVDHTAHSVAALLGMKMVQETGEFKPDPYAKYIPIENADIIIIDEASMINEEALDLIMNMKRYGAKVIFAGDVGQLPPIRKKGTPNEKKDSPAFDIEDQAQLLVRVRQGEESPILPYADNYWDNSTSESSEVMPIEESQRVDSITNKGNLIFTDGKSALPLAIEEFKKVFDTGDLSLIKVVTYHNASRRKANKIIHEGVLGEGASYFTPGTPMIFNNNYQPGQEGPKIGENSTEVKVIEVLRKGKHNGFDTVTVKLLNKENKEITITMLDLDVPNIKEDYDNYLKREVNRIKRLPAGPLRSKEWSDYYYENSLVADVDLAYAITSHKSQGSTYNTVIVNEDDIMGARYLTNKGKSQAMYTALTRAKNNVVVFSALNPNPTKENIPLIEASPTVSSTSEKGSFDPVAAQPQEEIKEPIRYTAATESKLYSMTDAQQVIKDTKDSDVIIISNGSRTVGDTGSNAKTSGWQFRGASNVIYIPSVESYSPFGKDTDYLIKDDNFTGQPVDRSINPEVKREIDAAIQQIKNAIRDGKKVYWDRAGYGQKMKEIIKVGDQSAMPAGKTYVYLSKKLFDAFGYINPGYLSSETFKKSFESQVQNPRLSDIQKAKTQAVDRFYENADVQEFIKQCLAK